MRAGNKQFSMLLSTKRELKLEGSQSRLLKKSVNNSKTIFYFYRVLARASTVAVLNLKYNNGSQILTQFQMSSTFGWWCSVNGCILNLSSHQMILECSCQKKQRNSQRLILTTKRLWRQHQSSQTLCKLVLKQKEASAKMSY